MRLALKCTAVVLLLPALTNRSPGAEPLSDLLGWVPGPANAVLFVDADELYKSEVAKKGKWGAAGQPMMGIDSLPPNVSKLLVASLIDPVGGPTWEVTVASLRKSVTDDELIRQTGGKRDSLAGKTVSLTPRHGVVASLAPGVVGAYQPANRQEVARWLRTSTGKVPAELSAYLKQAVASVKSATPIILAFDTTDMFDPVSVKPRLAKAPCLKGKTEAYLTRVSELVGGIRGVTLSVSVTDTMTAELRVEFDRSPDPFREYAKPLILEIFARQGLDSEEMNSWNVNIRQNTLSFGGALTQPTLDMLLSPFLRPGASSAGPGEPSAPDTMAQASVKYHQAIMKKIKELRSTHNATFPKLAYSFGQAARHIDELPILNVDDELLAWGGAVTTTIRTMALVAQAAGGQIDLLDANKMMVSIDTPNYYYGSAGGSWGNAWRGGSWGYNVVAPTGTSSNSLVSNYGQVANLQTMTAQQEQQYRVKTWNNLEAAGNELRRKMVKKYGVEF